MNDATLLPIKDFSALTGVTQSTLRYYDEIGLLPPAVRGANHYRYYTPYQMITLNFISVLIDLGLSLSTIRELSDQRTPERLLETLAQQETKLDDRLFALRTAYSIIHTYRSNIQTGLFAREDEIILREVTGRRIILGPETNFTNQDSFYNAFLDFCHSAEEYRVNLHYPIGAYHTDMAAYLNAPGRPERFFSLDPLGNTVCASGRFLTGYCRGYYGQFGDLPQRMAEFAEKNGLVLEGPVYALYIIDEVSEIDRNAYLSQVSVRVADPEPEKEESEAALPGP